MDNLDLETIKNSDAKPHALKKLPPQELFLNDDILRELLQARAQIAELKGYCLDYPNPLLLLSPAIIKESLASSEIENIHTTLIDVFQNSLLPESERRQADKEVLRYHEAIMYGYESLKKKPVISNGLAIGIHETLMQVSGQSFREDQNVIVNQDKKIVFVPPKAEDIPKLMRNWEEYVNSKSNDLKDDPLIKSAIAHYQFESIHPFDDGNGRTGRILMVLQLINADLLTAPILYISGYINRERSDYYRLLREVTNEGNWNEYVLFMVRGFREQAEKTKEHLLATRALFDETKHLVRDRLPSIYSHELIDAIFVSPIITATVLASKLRVHYITAGNYLRELQKLKILRSQKYGRHVMYGNIELMRLLNK